MRVLIVEPLGVVRAGLALLIESDPDMTVLDEASTGDEALGAVRRVRRRSDLLVLVSLGLTGRHDGLWLIRAIRELAPTVPVVATGGPPDGSLVSKAMFVGADGFVHHNVEPDRFLDALRRLKVGEVVLEGLPRDWFGAIADELTSDRPAPLPLTERESEVLHATTHLTRIYRKLGASGRVAAIAATASPGHRMIGGGRQGGRSAGAPPLRSA